MEDAETADSDGDDDDEKDKDGDKSTKTSDSATLAAIQKTLDSMNKRFTDMESELKEIKEKKDDDGKTGDTVLEAEEAERNTEAKGETYTGDMASVRQRAEILAPGFRCRPSTPRPRPRTPSARASGAPSMLPMPPTAGGRRSRRSWPDALRSSKRWTPARSTPSSPARQN